MKTLIVYFSWSNNTKNLVEKLNEEFNFDVIRIERKIPYSKDYNTCAYVEAKDEIEKYIYPEIKQLEINPHNYDRILLFFPIWWYTFPMPIGTFVKQLKGFTGEVIVFANSYTNDPKYMINSMHDLKFLDNKINFKQGLFNESTERHIEFLKQI